MVKLRNAAERFEKAGAQLIVVIPHDADRVERWQKRVGDAFPVVCDPGYVASCRYGVAFQMRIHTDTSNTPGTFVIDKKGVLAWSHVGTGKKSWGDRPSVDEILAQVDALGR